MTSEYEGHFQDIGLSIKEFEEQFDRALGSGGTLLADLTRKRIEIGVAAPYVQKVLGQVVGSMQTMITAREQVVASHLGLRDMRGLVEKGPQAYGACCEPSAQADKGASVVSLRPVG